MDKNKDVLYEDVLNEIFTEEYLITYGYFSDKKKYTEEQSEGNPYAGDIVSDIFSLDEFYSYIVEWLEYIEKQVGSKFFVEQNKGETEPIYYNIYKTEEVRRQLKFPNLYSYLKLVRFVCNNKKKFTEVFLKNKNSTSRYFRHNSYKWETTKNFQKRLLQLGDKRLHIDIANFYHTLYTRSIPWMVMGKGEAKKNKETGFSNKLDKLIRECQHGETHGVPVGSLLMEIIVELFMCKFDEKLSEEGFSYSRYVDDFIFSYTHEDEKNKFLEQVNLICREYNLYLNQNKVKIEKFPYEDKLNKDNIFNFFDICDFGKIEDEKKRKLILQYIDLCIKEEFLGNKGALKLIFTGIEKLKNDYSLLFIKDEITGISIYEMLLDVTFKGKLLSNRFIRLSQIIFRNEQSGDLYEKGRNIINDYYKRNKAVIKRNIKHYSKNKYDEELHQILLYMVQFDIEEFVLDQEELLDLINENRDDLTLCLITIVYIKNKYEIIKLLKRIDILFENTEKTYTKKTYDEKFSVFRMKFWYYRYFIYYLIKNEIIEKKECNRYINSLNRIKSKKNIGYKHRLNPTYIFQKYNDDEITLFYHGMYRLDVSLVSCGSNNEFKYFK